MHDGALGLALTAVDHLADAGLRAAVHTRFAAGGGRLDVPTTSTDHTPGLTITFTDAGSRRPTVSDASASASG